MARSRGRRYLPAQVAVHDAQAGGKTNALAALRQYRADGGSIRTQEWYRLWRLQQRDVGDKFAPPGGPPPVRGAEPGRQPIGWITVVAMVFWDPRDDRTYKHSKEVWRPGPRRMPDDQAMRIAVDEGPDGLDTVARRYGWVPIYTYVDSYQPVY